MSTQTEKLEFQAEVRELLDLMIHSLYTHREIFLRELISNASDALDKLRFEALTRPELLEEGWEPEIRLERDAAARTLTVADNGVGMSRDELVQNIGTIAKSGTRGFLAEARKSDAADIPRLIGQFGVGFYSSFMVADEVVLETRRAGEERGTRWTSKGDGSYTVEEVEKDGHGTSIALHLKPQKVEDGDDFQDFTAEWTLRDVVRKYSDFVEYPIRMDVEREEGEGDEQRTVTKTEVLNTQKPLWTRPRSELGDEDYAQFYKHFAHDWDDPFETIHFKAEGTAEYTALLFLPKRRPFDMFDPSRAKSKVALYVKRVHIMSECEELMPVWLRFVQGLVDSDDLPLNISRETLQHEHQLVQIRKRLVKKVLDALAKRLADDREAYVEFWDQFGSILKEGLYFESEHQQALLEAALFWSSRGDELTTLAEYVERMPVKQKEIYHLAGENKKALEQSPHLERARALGFEVLFLTDRVDEFAFQRVTEFEERPVKPLDRGDVELEEEDADKQRREERAKELEQLLGAIASELDDDVKQVRLSSRLADSPVVLVNSEQELSPNLARILRESNQPVPSVKRILEVNPEHPLLARMGELYESEGDSKRFADYCDLLYGQALLREGSPLPHPEHFGKLLSELMVEK